jgi:hypothetical protein
LEKLNSPMSKGCFTYQCYEVHGPELNASPSACRRQAPASRALLCNTGSPWDPPIERLMLSSPWPMVDLHSLDSKEHKGFGNLHSVKVMSFKFL